MCFVLDYVIKHKNRSNLYSVPSNVHTANSPSDRLPTQRGYLEKNNTRGNPNLRRGTTKQAREYPTNPANTTNNKNGSLEIPQPTRLQNKQNKQDKKDTRILIHQSGRRSCVVQATKKPPKEIQQSNQTTTRRVPGVQCCKTSYRAVEPSPPAHHSYPNTR